MRILLHSMLLGAVLLVSCTPEDIPEADKPLSLDAGICASVEGGEAVGTKTSGPAFEDGGLSMELVHEVTDWTDFPETAEGYMTKGSRYSTDAQLQSNVKTFRLTAYNSDGSSYIQNGTVTYSSSKWTLSGSVPVWKGLDTKTFIAYANLPSSGASVSCTSTSQTLTYTVPTAATAQTDILLGYYKGNGDKDGDGKADGYAKLRFYHPLTAVRFIVGDLHSSITGITQINIETAYNKGTLTVTYNPSGVPVYNWGSTLSTTTTFTQAVSGLPAKGSQIGSDFILIPQDLATQRVIVRVTVKTTSGSSVIYRVLNSGSWVAGKANAYTINCTS